MALAGKKIGTTERSDHEDLSRDAITRNPRSILYAKADEANLDLLVGRIDAVFGDELLLAKFLETREGGCCHILGDAPAEPAYSASPMASDCARRTRPCATGSTAPSPQVKADGTYDRIRAKYFSFDIK